MLRIIRFPAFLSPGTVAKKLIETYEVKRSAVLESPRHYGLGMGHKHLPEMKVRSGLADTPFSARWWVIFTKALR